MGKFLICGPHISGILGRLAGGLYLMWCRMFFPIFFLLSGSVIAQIVSTPTPTPRPGSRQGSLNPISADTTNFERLRSLDLMIPKDRAEKHPLLDPKKGIYRRPGKNEIEPLEVSEPLLTRYDAFLKQRDTGIVKLNADSSCLSDVDVVVASEKCIVFKMPGAGVAYSFRTESYRLPRLADVILLDGIFKTGGVYQQVTMADIGDVPIDQLSLDTKGMKFLVDMKPVLDSDEFLRFDKEIAQGIESGGYLYRKGHPVRENATFVLRSIAYRGRFLRTVDGIQYDELDFDRRRDVIVGFRVVEKDPDGNITILWKKFKDVESPILKVPK